MDNKFKILNFLGRNIGGSFTMLALSKAAGVPYATLHRTLASMGDLILVKDVGKSRTVSLLEDRSVLPYLAVSSEEAKRAFLLKQPIIRKISSELHASDIVLLFGSYAKGSQRQGSDIDMMVVSRSGNRSVSFGKYETLFDVEINPVFFSYKEFKSMIRDPGENVGRQALRDHVVLNEPIGFWRLVLDG